MVLGMALSRISKSIFNKHDWKPSIELKKLKIGSVAMLLLLLPIVVVVVAVVVPLLLLHLLLLLRSPFPWVSSLPFPFTNRHSIPFPF